MKLVVASMILMLVLALGALEILAARDSVDADVPGDSAVRAWIAR